MDLFEIVKEFWWALIASVFAIVLIISTWDKIRWKAMNYWYGFPFIGKVARLSKDTRDDKHNVGWLKSERALCADYKKFIGVQSKEEFNRYINYLNKSGDTGRGTTPPFIWVLIIGLVIAEALGFSYVLAGYAIPGASEQIQLYGSIGIAFVISVLLVFLTHLTGSELYLNSVISGARESWNNLGQKGPLSQGIDVDLSQNEKDDQEPAYSQTLHRTRKKKSTYFTTISTLVLVCIVAAGSTYIRSTVLEKQLIDDVSGSHANFFAAPAAAIGIPTDLQKIANNAEEKAMTETQDLERKGGWTTFIILAVLFVFIQILGVIFGYKWGFAGKQSKAAYKGLGRGRFHTYDDVIQHKDNISDEAQARLENLQQKLEKNNASTGSNAIKTHKRFEDFLYEDAESKHQSQQKHASIGTIIANEQPLSDSDNTDSLVTENPDDELARLKAEMAEVEKNKQQQAQAKEIEELKRQLAEAKNT